MCFSRSSLLRGALIITRRTLDGALKCAFRDFLREECSAVSKTNQHLNMSKSFRLTGVYFGHDEGDAGVVVNGTES